MPLQTLQREAPQGMRRSISDRAATRLDIYRAANADSAIVPSVQRLRGFKSDGLLAASGQLPDNPLEFHGARRRCTRAGLNTVVAHG